MSLLTPGCHCCIRWLAGWKRQILSEAPLVRCQKRGSGSGGKVLTEDGHIFLGRALLFRQHLAKLVTFFNETPEDAFTMLKTMKGMEVSTIIKASSVLLTIP